MVDQNQVAATEKDVCPTTHSGINFLSNYFQQNKPSVMREFNLEAISNVVAEFLIMFSQVNPLLE